MRPSNPTKYFVNIVAAYAKLFGQFFCCFIGKSYKYYICLSQFCTVIFNSMLIQLPCSSLLCAVVHIVFLIANKKVFWIAAARIVTFMTNKQTSWDWSINKNSPSISMGKPSNNRAAWPYAYDAMSHFVDFCTLPLPARRGFRDNNFRNKSIPQWNCGSCFAHILTYMASHIEEARQTCMSQVFGATLAAHNNHTLFGGSLCQHI